MSVSAMGRLYRAMARSRLFSSARAIASCNEIYSLPSRIRCSMRGELSSCGGGTWLGAEASNGLCGWGIAKGAGVCMESWAGVVELDVCGVGAFGICSGADPADAWVCAWALTSKQHRKSTRIGDLNRRFLMYKLPPHSA